MNLIKMTDAAVFVSYDSGTKPTFSLAGGRTQSQMFWIDGGAGQNMRLGIGRVDGGHTLGAPDFGIVSHAAGGRTIQLGLRGAF